MYKLSVRTRPRGRGLQTASTVKGWGDPATSGRNQLTFFVHGFNNNLYQASDTWQVTCAWLKEKKISLNEVVLFFWPGDYFKNSAGSALYYFKQIPTANETAQELANYIESLAKSEQNLKVSFVAHSLGSLVVLQTLHLLKERGIKVSVPHVLLMAAAVPVGSCAQKTSPRPGKYSERFSLRTNEQILHSPSDLILKHCFRPGQALAKTAPVHEKFAVGYSGGPSAGKNRRWSASQSMYLYRHSDYWQSDESLQVVAEVLGRTVELKGHTLRAKQLRKRYIPIAKIRRRRIVKATLACAALIL